MTVSDDKQTSDITAADATDVTAEPKLEPTDAAERAGEQAPASVAAPEPRSHADVIDPDGALCDEATQKEKSGAFIEELIKIGVKTVAVAVSVVMLILSILTVALPLSAMRVFNKLGMEERAMNSGDRYISRRLDKEDANVADDMGNYVRASQIASLNDDDMREALTVCISLSDSLMAASGDGDARSAEYFAEKLDEYIRIYLSLNGISAVNDAKSAQNVSRVAPALRPFVYDYAHSLRTLDYEARVRLGKTDVMLYNTNINGVILTPVIERSQTYAGLQFGINTSKNNMISILDGFVDYIDQLSAYLAVVQKRLGVKGLLSEQKEDQEKYGNVLNGDEFSLFITPENGFTPVFTNLVNGLSKFTKYAQAAVDFGFTTLDEELHRLYWLRILASASDRLLNLGRLLHFNRAKYGMYAAQINEYYSTFTFDYFRFVKYNNDTAFISSVYNSAMADYLAHYSI